MNKLVFSEGGQPVYLDDLRLLQENMQELLLSLFPVTRGSDDAGSDDAGHSNSVGLPVYSTARHLNGNADGNCETMQAHKLITASGVYDVGEFTLHEGDASNFGYYSYFIEEAPLYYLLEERVAESREFEDGQTRPVIKSCTARVVIGNPGTGTCYRLSDVPSFDGLLAELLYTRRQLRRYFGSDTENND